MKMALKTTKSGLAVTAAALLIVGCASNQQSSEVAVDKNSDMGQCHGVNSCKGTGSCATATTNCAGQNACKGQGWLPLNKAACDSRGGMFKGFKK